MKAEDFKRNLLPLKNRIFRLALKLLGSIEDAEDVTQEVFIKLWQNREKLAQHQNVEGFAMLTTRNLSIDKLRAKKKMVYDVQDYLLVDNKTPESSYELKDTVKVLKSIIDNLPEQQKTIFHLREVEEMSIENIAEAVNLSNINVRVTLSRIRKKVKEIFMKEYSNEKY